jgi:Helicase HerA, central domain
MEPSTSREFEEIKVTLLAAAGRRSSLFEANAKRSRVRQRLLPAGVGFAAFTVLGALGSSEFWTQPWFFVGLGTAVSATFVEPYFAKPQDAIVNSAGGIGAVAGVETSPVDGLWLMTLFGLIIIALAGITAAISSGERGATLKWASFRLASRVGRAAVIGPLLLILIVITAAAHDEDGFQLLAAATVVLTLAVAIDWHTVLTRISRRHEAASTVAAIGPRLLLVSAASQQFEPGDSISLETVGGQAGGSIVARMPHADGLRYQIALDREWSEVCGGFPEEVVLEDSRTQSTLIGSVGEGTTERSLEFEPFRTLTIGDPVSLKVGERNLIYQVARLELKNSSWLGANALVSHATAHIVGWPEERFLRGGSYLPSPHDVIYETVDAAAELPEEYYEIGKVKGTDIPIGFRIASEKRGHLAILGMSGMGKTAVAQRVCKKLGEDTVVVALDTTGEYATHLDFPQWDSDLNAAGHRVYEPEGDPPKMASEFFKECMQAGAEEYKSGKTPTSRVILFEEAHGFVPEWNFALKRQQDDVAMTTRAIMQARKFGITVVLVSQRTAVVSKSALSQCENYIILKTLDKTSLEYLEALVGSDMRHAIPNLKRYEALCVGPAFNAEEPVIVTLSPP